MNCGCERLIELALLWIHVCACVCTKNQPVQCDSDFVWQFYGIGLKLWMCFLHRPPLIRHQLTTHKIHIITFWVYIFKLPVYKIFTYFSLPVGSDFLQKVFATWFFFVVNFIPSFYTFSLMLMQQVNFSKFKSLNVLQVGWSTARDYYTFLWSPLPENYVEGTAVNRTVVFQGYISSIVCHDFHTL